MFIRYFQSSYLSQYIVLAVMELIIWLPRFINPEAFALPEETTPFYNFFEVMLRNIPLVAVLITFILVYLEGIMLNSILSEHQLIPRNSLIPALIYVLIISFVPDIHTIHPIILVNFFIILIMRNGFGLYGEREPLKIVFPCGINISIASLIFNPSIFILVILYSLFILMSIITWRSWVVPMIGFIIPLLFTGTYYFWTDSLNDFLLRFSNDIINLRLVSFDYNLSTIVLLSTIGLLLLITVMNIVRTQSSKNIDIRKKLTTIIYMLLFLLVIFITNDQPNNSVILFMVPGAAITGIVLAEKQMLFYYNLLVVMIFLIGVYLSYAALWFPETIF